MTVGNQRETFNKSSPNPDCGTFFGPTNKTEAYVQCLSGSMPGKYVTVQKMFPSPKENRYSDKA